MTEREFIAAESEVELFQRGRNAAAERLRGARNMCDAVAGQDYAIQAEATVDLENAIAVGSEWGIVNQAGAV